MQHAELLTYFAAERVGAWVLLGMAAASFIGAVLLWQSKGAFTAMIWPLVLFGGIELMIGTTIAVRTPTQVGQLEAAFADDRGAMAQAELDRMERIERNFVIAKTGEAVLIVAGLVAVLWLPVGSTWSAVGLGVVLHGAALLVFDSFAHQRAEVYIDWLQRL